MEITTLLQKVIPILVQSCKVERFHIGVDLATRRTGKRRGDIWISTAPVTHRDQFEDGIICLIEAKLPSVLPIADEKVYMASEDGNYSLTGNFAKCLEEDLGNYKLGRPYTSEYRSNDWFDGVIQGRVKASLQGLASFAVTNCHVIHFYHTESLAPICVVRNGTKTPIRFWPKLDLLQVLAGQLGPSRTAIEIEQVDTAVDNPSEFEFVAFLERIHNRGVFRFNDENVRINTLLTFVFFKFFDERIRATNEQIHARVVLWSDFLADIDLLHRQHGYTNGDHRGLHIATKIKQQLGYLASSNNVYAEEYRQFAQILAFPDELDAEENYSTIDEIYKEFSRYHFHGCAFDVYGAIYETFTSDNTKKELGQFYTRRHISRLLARLTLRHFTDLNIDGTVCDPACGTGGLLTECFSFLRGQMASTRPSRQLTASEEHRLREEMFEGYDIFEENVVKARLNMFFAGDSGGGVGKQDSVAELPCVISEDDRGYAVVIANPPMGRGQEYYKRYISWGGRRRNDLVFVERMVKALNYGGRFGFVVPDGFLENPSLATYRRRFLEQVKIEAIISLPKFAFAPYTKNKTSLVIGNRRDYHTVMHLVEDTDYPALTNNAVGIDSLKRGTKANRNNVFENLDDAIWLYVIDFDGYANSDWRFPTNLHKIGGNGLLRFLHNDIENDLTGGEEDRYLDGRIEAWDEIDTDGQLLGQNVLVDGVERVRLVKADFVYLNDQVNQDNRWNLLPEFHLRPYVDSRSFETPVEIRSLAEQTIDRAKTLVREITDRLPPIPQIDDSSLELKEFAFEEIFDDPAKGSSGLTKVAMYESILQGPPYIPKWGGQIRHDVVEERVSRQGRNNKGKPIRVFRGECLILSLDGSAGCMTYKPEKEAGQPVEFALNHHAAVLRPKESDLVDLRYFKYRYEPYLKFLAVSQASSTLTLGLLKSQVFELPDFTVQKAIADQLEILWDLQRGFDSLSLQVTGASEEQNRP